jgi:hypothetical protein
MPAPLAIEPLPAAPVLKCVGEQALKNCISVFKPRGTLQNTHGYLHAGVIVATSRNIETTQSRHSKTKLITEPFNSRAVSHDLHFGIAVQVLRNSIFNLS